VPPVVVAAGAWGLVAAGLAGARQAGRGAMGVVVGTAVVYAVAFGLVVPGLQPLTLVDQLVAMFGPVVLFGAVLAAAWCWRGGPWAVGVFVLVVALAWISGLADGAVLRRTQGQLWGLFVFPLPVWGPALGAAVLGYALRRRGNAVAPGTIEGS
jgi:hypothetical protein